MKIKESKTIKHLSSDTYNYLFNKETGFFMRWGKTEEDDPHFSPQGPEILDIEISEICTKGCKFCYKGNTNRGTNMSLDTWKVILDRVLQVPTLTQVAFGIGDIDSNPDLWKIMEHTRERGIVPNITINGDRMISEYYDKLVELCGAVSVSHYSDDECFNAVRELTSRGLKQVNIHQVVSEESYDDCLALVEKAATDDRLRDLNAIVFLALKPKGRGKNIKPLKSVEKYRKLVNLANEKKVGIGFDSCSAPTFLAAMKDDDNYKHFEQLSDACESMLFSIYINVKGEVYPCSFIEGQPGYEGLKIDENTNFVKDIWYHPSIVKWREKLLATANCEGCLVKGCRQCPEFDIY